MEMPYLQAPNGRHGNGNQGRFSNEIQSELTFFDWLVRLNKNFSSLTHGDVIPLQRTNIHIPPNGSQSWKISDSKVPLTVGDGYLSSQEGLIFTFDLFGMEPSLNLTLSHRVLMRLSNGERNRRNFLRVGLELNGDYFINHEIRIPK